VFFFLLPFLEQDNIFRSTADYSSNTGPSVVPIYLAPHDPTVPAGGVHNTQPSGGVVNNDIPLAAISYAANCLVFGGDKVTAMSRYLDPALTDPGVDDHANISVAAIPRTFTDGTSTTILFMEKYAVCSDGRHTWANDCYFTGGNLAHPTSGSGYNSQWTPLQQHLFSPEIQPPPATASCNHPQALSPSGIGVALADGSARLVNGSINNLIWRLALLPDDGQVMPAEW